MISPYGKIYARLYDGSMYGKGSLAFAVMGYVISHQYPSSREKDAVMFVELNTAKLADTLGEKEEDVRKTIKFLCSPDADSRSKEEGGRRLVEEEPFKYRVVNGRYYRDLADEERRRLQNVVAQRVHRAKLFWRKQGLPLPGEVEYLKAVAEDAPNSVLEAIEKKWLPGEKSNPQPIEEDV